MKIVWDEQKRESNLFKHGIDFSIFDFEMLKEAYFELSYSSRIKAIFYLKDTPLAIIFVPLGNEAISLISFRPASKKERNKLK